MTPHRYLRRDLVWILAVKFAALALLRVLFFSPAQQPAADAVATARHIARLATSEHSDSESSVPAVERSRD
jgi:hypothetical protein